MSDYLSKTGLQYYHNRIKALFASKENVDALEDQVEDLIAAGGEPNVIEAVKVNGAALAPDAGKAVNVTVPTAVSDLTNDSGFQTASDVQTAIASAVSSAYIYKGSVPAMADLPASGNATGDVYDVQATGMNYAWNGTAWDPLGSYVDTSTLWGKTELVAITTAEIDDIISPPSP